VDKAQKMIIKRELRSLCEPPSCVFCHYLDVWSNTVILCWNSKSKFNGLCVRPDHVCKGFLSAND